MCKKGLNCKSSVRQIIHFIKAFVFLFTYFFFSLVLVRPLLLWHNFWSTIDTICCVAFFFLLMILFYFTLHRCIDDIAIFTGALTGVHFSVMLQTRIFILFITYFNFVVFFNVCVCLCVCIVKDFIVVASPFLFYFTYGY